MTEDARTSAIAGGLKNVARDGDLRSMIHMDGWSCYGQQHASVRLGTS